MSKSKPKSSYIYLAIIIIILFLIVLVLIKIIIYYNNTNEDFNSQSSISPLTVTRVIDGDTFVLANGQIVRLICLDTPEQGSPGSEEAKYFLESLVLDKEVRLEKDVSDKDKYDRLLRYVYVNMTKDKNDNVNQLESEGKKEEEAEVFVNQEMVKEGFATIFKVPPDTKRCGEINRD